MQVAIATGGVDGLGRGFCGMSEDDRSSGGIPVGQATRTTRHWL